MSIELTREEVEEIVLAHLRRKFDGVLTFPGDLAVLTEAADDSEFAGFSADAEPVEPSAQP